MSLTTDIGFYKIHLPFESNLFKELSHSVEFEKITKGRIANQLVDIKNKLIPIIRTTSKYSIPAQNFADVHHLITNTINQTLEKIDFPIQHLAVYQM